MALKTPRCERLGYIIGDEIRYNKHVMCKDCESKQKEIAKDGLGFSIYDKLQSFKVEQNV